MEKSQQSSGYGEVFPNKTDVYLMKEIVCLTKKILLQLGFAAAASASDAGMQNKRLDQYYLMKW